MKKGLYIHIPFCKEICSYCDFCKCYYDEQLAQKYIDILIKDIALVKEEIKTIYIGGGTPSVLSDILLEKLLKSLIRFTDEKTEFSIEINPETMSETKMFLLAKYKVNRLSIGVQTFQESLLMLIERKHNNNDVFDCIKLAKKYGINNISIDLMYGLPKQKIIDVKKDLAIAMKLPLKHISYYNLILEDHTILKIKNFEIDQEEKIIEYENLIVNTLQQYGFNKYEISNYAKSGFESKHNLIYWNNEQYVAVGLGAHGQENGVRYEYTRSLTNYLQNKKIIKKEKLSINEQMFESIMMGLRLVSGIKIEIFNQRYNNDLLKVFENAIDKNIKLGNLIIDDGYLKTTTKGMDLLNEVLIDFI